MNITLLGQPSIESLCAICDLNRYKHRLQRCVYVIKIIILQIQVWNKFEICMFNNGLYNSAIS